MNESKGDSWSRTEWWVMPEAFIVDAVRTPVGKRGGGFTGVHPADFAGHVLNQLVDRTGIAPEAVDDVILGLVDAIGTQSGNVARTAVLVSGLPETVPGITVDRQCGSSQQAVQFASQAIQSGQQDLVIAGGVQKMSQYPLLSGYQAGEPYGETNIRATSPGWKARYGDVEVTQFAGAESIAKKWGITREECEEFALRSHANATEAIDAGWFDAEITPYVGVSADECPRRTTSREALAALNTLRDGGILTAGTSSQISDGASGVLVASERAVERFGLKPLARVVHASALGDDPVMMLSAPIPATRRALEAIGLSVDQIDTFEVNEAFAPVVLAWIKDLGVDPARVNPNGGAIALGHPIGATGTRLMTTMVHRMRRTGQRYGLQVMCEGGGQANVTILERL